MVLVFSIMGGIFDMGGDVRTSMFNKRVLITIDEELLTALDADAEREGLRRSEYIRTIARKYLAGKGVEVAPEEQIQKLEKEKNWTRYRKPGKRYPVPFEEKVAFTGEAQPIPPEMPDAPIWHKEETRCQQY